MTTLNHLFRNSLQISRRNTINIQSCFIPASFTTQNDNVLSPTITTITHRTISSNRSKRGLYDGKDIRSGNNVSFSMKKTKRKFKPNVFRKRIYSEMLDEMIHFHVTTSALRTIDKYGGLDNYLLRSRHVKDGQGEGGLVKKRLLAHISYCERHGLDVLPDVTLKSATVGTGGGKEKGTIGKDVGDGESTIEK